MADRPGVCAYSLDNIDWTAFPYGPKFDFGYGLEESNISLETDIGRRFIYSKFSRDRWDITFRFTETERSAFQDFHDAVDGQITPFYLSLGVAGVASALIYGRKTAGFFPAGISVPAIPVIYEYRFTIIGSVVDIDLTTDFVTPVPFAGSSFGGLW